MIHFEQFEDVRWGDSSRCPFADVSISLIDNFKREDVSLSSRDGPPGIVGVPTVGLAPEDGDKSDTITKR